MNHREVIVFPTLDEAIAEALRGTTPGEVIEIHDESCCGTEQPDPPWHIVGCTCEPMTLIAGASA